MISKKRIKNICKRWMGQFLFFDPRIALGDFLCSTLLRNSNSKLKHNLSESYYNRAKAVVEKKYTYVINSWKNYDNEECGEIKEDAPIFIFWWQGIDVVPPIVRGCIDSITEHAGTHSIVVIDKNNYGQYAKIPEYIMNKVDKGIINFTLFSDILRCCLLYENGGIWIDSTCFMTNNFSSDLYSHKFYTIKHGDSWEFPVCKGYWATFFLAASKNNPLMGFMRDLFFEFWKREKAFIVYLSIDLFLNIAYDQFTWAKQMIDAVPYNNMNRDDLRNMLLEHNGEEFDELIKKVDSETYIHKLTYKMKVKKFS